MFLSERWLWEDLEPAEHVLLFQSGNVLCANAVRSVDEFFKWGPSLRKRSRVLDELAYMPDDATEGQWYYAR